MSSNNNILQYESKIWATADLLRGCGIKESEWPSFMMPFFALIMIESRLARLLEELKAEHGQDVFVDMDPEYFIDLISDKGMGYNVYIFEQNKTLKDICRNDKSFDVDFMAYLKGFDGETKDLLGVDAVEGLKYLDMRGVVSRLKAKEALLGYVKEWSQIDLKPFNNSEITTLEEHIKRKWADISAETAGEQYTPDDVIALIAEIVASKIEESKQLLKIYDCTCGGGNLLFGVEDRVKEKVDRFTQTFGQDWNDALYALAKIESRFRIDSYIEHANTMTNDKFYNHDFDVVVANPPYGVSWKGYQKDIIRDKTGRFHFLPSVSDGQLLFMQHLISKMASTGIGVVVHNGSTLFSGDAGSAESNIRKWMLDSDIVEAIIQLPTDEFFNTGIYTYLWVLNKNKDAARKDKVMLINASGKFKPLKKSKGSKRKEMDPANRLEIVATLTTFADNDYARVFDKEFFYFNKQAIRLTNVDEQGRSFAEQLEEGKKSLKLKPLKISNSPLEKGARGLYSTNSPLEKGAGGLYSTKSPLEKGTTGLYPTKSPLEKGAGGLYPTTDNFKEATGLYSTAKNDLNESDDKAQTQPPKSSFVKGDFEQRTLTDFSITKHDQTRYKSLKDEYEQDIKPFVSGLDYKEQPLTVTTPDGAYKYAPDQGSLIKEAGGTYETLGAGKIVVKSTYKKAGKTQPERIEISGELTPDYEKDYEIIPYFKDEAENKKAIADFMAKYITKPFEYLDNVVGVEINFNKVFYQPEKLRPVTEIVAEIDALDEELKKLEGDLAL